MKLISTITADAKQTMTIVLNDGSIVSLDLWYTESQSAWNYSVVYGAFAARGRRMVNSPNMLRQFKNIIPFGLACIVNDGLEPVYIDDFTSGRAALYILEQEDVLIVEDSIITGYQE